jgi:pilus assembly protein Flp/PilA
VGRHPSQRTRDTLFTDTRGATLVEYILLVGLIALVALAAFEDFGWAVDDKIQEQASCMDGECAPGSGRARAPTGWVVPSVAARLEVQQQAIDARRRASLWSGVKSFFAGAVLGSFAGDAGWAGIAGQTGVGLVPIAGQIADGRDTIAALRDVWRREPGAGLMLGASLVAWVPGLDFVKGLVRGGKKALSGVANAAEGASRAAKQAAKTSDEIAAAVGRGVQPKVLERLGSGMQGKVYLTDIAGNRVAVKVPHTADAEGLDSIRSTITPPEYGGPPTYGIAKLEVDGQQLEGIVMKHIDGGSLADAVKNPAAAPKITDGHIQQLEALMAKAERDGVAYGDLNTTNVLLGKDGSVHIVDNRVRPLKEIAEDPFGGLEAAEAMKGTTRRNFEGAIRQLRQVQVRQP